MAGTEKSEGGKNNFKMKERNSACYCIQALMPQGESKMESGIFAIRVVEGVAGLVEESISFRGPLIM